MQNKDRYLFLQNAGSKDLEKIFPPIAKIGYQK